MENVLIFIILLLIVGSIFFYLKKAKRQGKKCIGCPYAENCHKRCSK